MANLSWEWTNVSWYGYLRQNLEVVRDGEKSSVFCHTLCKGVFILVEYAIRKWGRDIINA